MLEARTSVISTLVLRLRIRVEELLNIRDSIWLNRYILIFATCSSLAPQTLLSSLMLYGCILKLNETLADYEVFQRIWWTEKLAQLQPPCQAYNFYSSNVYVFSLFKKTCVFYVFDNAPFPFSVQNACFRLQCKQCFAKFCLLPQSIMIYRSFYNTRISLNVIITNID